MTDGVACSAFEEPARDGLEERLAEIQPELRAHLTHGSRRVPGMEPDDLAQEVVTRALRYRDKYDSTQALWPWLRRVAQRVLIDHRSAAARTLETPLKVEIEAPEQTPEVDAREELERVLAGLRPLEREILLRFHRSGESIQQIGTTMGMREGTVKSHLSRTRRKLAGMNRKELNDEE